MIVEGFNKEVIKEENLYFAEPIEIIAQECKPIQKRLRDDSILYQLKSIFVVDSLFREVFIRKFYREIPFLGLPDYDKIGIDPFQELFQFLRKNNGVDSFLSWLEARHKHIYDGIDFPPNYCFFNFVNRKYECEKACGDHPAQYILFDAPTKYGKTELLKAIELKSIKKQWYCIYTEIPSSISSLELAQLIKKEAKIDTVLSNPTLHDIGTLIACKYEGKKLLLLIDNLERLSNENIAAFLNEFIPAMQNVLPDVRVQMAAQYISATWDRKWEKKIPLTVCLLSPFKFRCVRETVELRLPDLDETALDLCAAYLMHITGGHPGLMAQIIDTMPQAEEKQLTAFQHSYKNVILDAANKILEDIPACLQNVFDVLSVFRRYNARLLNKIIENGIIEWDGNEYGLEKKLLSTYLVKREKGFITDEITRRLLAVRLRLEDKDWFLLLCEKARDIYQEDLQNAVSSPEIIAIEGLYQELQLGYCDEVEGREKLRERFFAYNGILRNYLTLLTKHPGYADNFANLITRLQDEESEWEFRFTVNFCLCGEQYSDAPYKQLCRQVESFAKELEKGSHE